MSQSMILRIGAAVSAVFGLALVFAPNQLVTAYGADELNQTGIYNSMLYGATLLGIAIMNWMASSASVEHARFVVLGNFAASAFAALVALVRQVGTDTAHTAGWINVAIFVLFAVLYGYLYFAREAVERHTAGIGAR
jgi:hypothetical protein